MFEQATLRPVVRRALDQPSAEVVDWDATPLGYAHTNAATEGILRVAGTARVGGDVIPWSVVHKRLHPIPEELLATGAKLLLLSPDDVAAFGVAQLWNREALLHHTDVLDLLDGDLRAPRCFGVEASETVAWLWLEDVAHPHELRWSLDRYRLAARHLGQFNGRYLTGGPLPAYDWLSRDWLRAWLYHSLRQEFLSPLPEPSLWGQIPHREVPDTTDSPASLRPLQRFLTSWARVAPSGSRGSGCPTSCRGRRARRPKRCRAAR